MSGNDEQELCRSRALALMRMALALLDRSGRPSLTAARLQHAIDTAVSEWPTFHEAGAVHPLD